MPNDPPALLERVTSGIAGLDTILHGGFLKGGLYIIQGPPGTGKTTFGNQLCFHHAGNAGHAIYVTLLAEYHSRMMQHLNAMSFFDPSKIPDHITYLNGLGVLHDGGLENLLGFLRREITAHNATMLVIDGIVSAQRAARDEQAFNEFIHEIQAIAIATDCTMFILTSAQRNLVGAEHTMVDGIIELKDEVTEWAAASSLQVVKFRGSDFLRGRHSFKITSSGLTVHPRIEALYAQPSRIDVGGDERITSGIPKLDVMFGGGVPVASTTMVMGPSGTGKTTLGMSFLSGSSEAEPGLLFGFYETPKRILAKAAGVCPDFCRLAENGAIEILWQPPTDDLLDAYGERLLEAVHRRGVQRLFIDGLGAFETAASGAGRIGLFLTTLMNEMRVRGVTTFYSYEVPYVSGPNIKTSIGELSGLAENLVMLRYVELGSQLHRLISVLKVRDSEFDPTLHEFKTSRFGINIEATPEGANRIMSGYSSLSPVRGRAKAPPDQDL